MMAALGRPVVSGLLALACWGLLGSPRRLAAEVTELPAEIPLDAAGLTFDLSDAVLKIEVRSGADPVLRARVMQEGRSARLEAVGDGGALTVRRPEDGGDGRPPRLRIEAVMTPGQRLVLTGSGLDLTIDDPPPDPAATAEPAPATDNLPALLPSAPSRAVFHLALAGSEADLAGLQNPVLDLAATSVWLTGTGGNLSLKLEGGAAEIRDHRGMVNLAATGAEVGVEGLEGALMARLEGGSLAVTEGRGGFNANAQNAAILVDGWRGQLRLNGNDNTLDARAGGNGKAPWTFQGQGLQLTLDGIETAIVANLDGGALRGSGFPLKVEASARNGATIDLTDLRGPLQLSLTDGADARLSGVKAQLTAELQDASLQAQGIERLSLTAARSRVTASGVSKVVKLEATDSELDLEFDGTELRPSLDLRGTSFATVRLTTPCLVELKGTAAPAERQVRLSGCDLMIPGQRLRSRQAMMRYGSGRLVVLKASLGQDAALEIVGRP